MNRYEDFPPHDPSPGERRVLEELSRLLPRRPSGALCADVAAALAEPSALPEPSGPRPPWRWLAERLAWAGGGAVAATLLLGVPGTPRPAAAVATVPSERVVAGDPAAPEPVAEESLAWADEGVRYLADGVPARVYRHWVLERHPEPSGRESLLPREDVFVVPVALR